MSEIQHTGGCHCGAFRYSVRADLSSAIRCNCSHCSAKGLLIAFVTADEFKIEQGEDSLAEYRFNTHAMEHRFCRTCGVQPFARTRKPGDDTMLVALNVRTVDGIDESKLDLTPWDGASL
jgi:hypothetical protein